METIKKRFSLFLAVLVATVNLFPVALASNDNHNDDHHNDHHGAELEVSKEAAGHVQAGTYTWGITKVANPTNVDMFYGDSQNVDYTVNVTKSGPSQAQYYVSGNIYVKNKGDESTSNLKITDKVQKKLNSNSSWSDIVSVNVDVSADPVLSPGESYNYPYTIYFTPGSYHDLRNYVKVEVDNFRDHDIDYVSDTDSFSLPNTPAPLNNSIAVNDTNGYSWNFSNSGSANYSQSFVCGQSSEYGNTATIVETGQTATANVNVNCYGLEVTKTVNTSFDRDYDWTISKTASALNFNLQVGQTANVDFIVNVSSVFTDKNWMATGNIDVHNPAPIPATINSVTDVISPDISADVTCSDVTFPYVLGAGQTLACTYAGNLPDGTDRTNTATATLENNQNNQNFSAQVLPTTDFTDTKPVSFEEAAMNEIDECIDVTDTYQSVTTALGNVCRGNAQFNVPGNTVGPYSAAGVYTIPTPADFVTNDTASVGDTPVDLTVTVAAILGATDTRLPGSILGATTSLSGSGANLYQIVALLFMFSLGLSGVYLLTRKKA